MQKSSLSQLAKNYSGQTNEMPIFIGNVANMKIRTMTPRQLGLRDWLD